MKNILTFLFIAMITINCGSVRKAKKIILQGEVVQSNFYKKTKYDKLKEWIIIETKLNGSNKKRRFLFDTGAVTVVSEALAKELNLPNIVERPIGSSNKAKKTQKKDSEHKISESDKIKVFDIIKRVKINSAK